MLNNRKFLLRVLVDLIEIAHPLPQIAKRTTGKNILIFNWRDLRHSRAGGAEVYVHELAKRWVEQGHTVTLFCGNDGNSPRREEIDGVRIVRRGGAYLVYVWAFLYYLVRFRGRYDVIIDCHNGVPFFTPLYAKEPVIGVVHHIHQEVFRRFLPKPLAEFAAWLERVVMPWAYRSNQLIAVSQSTKQEMLELGLEGAGIEIVHNGVDLESLYPSHKSDSPLVVYLGRLQQYKSIDVLLHAFKQVKISVPNAKLVVAGSGQDAVRLKRLAATLELTDSVQFRGRISEHDKKTLLQRAWVVVNPSLTEGWGITTIEANACGTPVVGSNVPGLRDSIQAPHTGYLAPHGDHAAFANHIQELLTNERLRTRMSDNAVNWAKQFQWSTSSRRALELINSETR